MQLIAKVSNNKRSDNFMKELGKTNVQKELHVAVTMLLIALARIVLK